MENLRIDFLHRAIAKTIDCAIALFLSQFSVAGIVLGTLYLFVADFFFDGQSIGKKLMKIKVVKSSVDGTLSKVQLRDAILRNFGFAVLLFLVCLPIIKYLAYLATPVFLGIELYFVYFDPKGVRLGDIYAETLVVAEAQPLDVP